MWKQQGPVHRIVSQGGLVLDVKDNGTANGTPVQLWAQTGGRNQQWVTLRCDGSPHLVLKSVSAQKCLDVSQRKPLANGNPVYVYQCHYRANQQWDHGNDGGMGTLSTGLNSDYLLDAQQPRRKGSVVRMMFWSASTFEGRTWGLNPI